MTTAPFFRVLAITAVLLSIGVAATAQSDDDSRDWSKAPASEIHQRLAEGKAAAMGRSGVMRQMAAANPSSTQTNYDVLFYDVYIRVNDTAETLTGRVKMVAVAAMPNVTAIEIDLYGNMSVDSIKAPSGALTFSRAANVVTVTLDSTYRIGEQFEFDVWYFGHPTEAAGFGAFVWETYSGEKTISSLSEPYFARTWWPCKDRMDDKADSFNIAIEVDTSFYVGSNGTLDSTVYNGANSHTFFYRVRYPMASYLLSLAISDFTVWYDQWIYNDGADTMPLVHAVFPSWYTSSLTSFAVTPLALTIFSDLFGPYPFAEEKYGHAHFTWGGAMEHQTMSSMTANSFSMGTTVIVHEMSHQWWGDMITCESWRDIWLNEGWASYAEALYYEALGGWTAYIDHMNGMRYTSGGTIYCQDTSSAGSIFTSRVYDKGAWALHMLRGVLGDSLFFDGVHAYYNSQYQHKWATTDEFRDVMETATGVELDWFFTEWIHGEYYPNYRWYWTSEPDPAGGHTVFLRVKQVHTSNPQVFKMPVRFTYTGISDTTVVWIDERDQRVKLHVPSAVSALNLDPMNWILKTQQRLTWTMFMVTLRDELRAADQNIAYADTIEVRGGSGNRSWNLVGGALPTGLTLSNSGVVSGTPTDTGLFTFLVNVQDLNQGYTDQADFTLYVTPNPGMPGDVNDDGTLNVADLTYMVKYLFQAGPPPLVLNSGDLNMSCTINVADLTYLVDFLFRSGPAPLPGCVN